MLIAQISLCMSAIYLPCTFPASFVALSTSYRLHMLLRVKSKSNPVKGCILPEELEYTQDVFTGKVNAVCAEKVTVELHGFGTYTNH